MDDMVTTLRFAEFELDRADRQLRLAGEPVELGARYFDALVLLASHSGTLVTKDRFMDEVWKGVPVTDEALTQCIRSLRRALGDEAGAPRFIETVPKHGYRFIAKVERGAERGLLPDGIPQGRSPAPPAARIAEATTLGGGIAGLVGGIFYGTFAMSGGFAGFVALVLLASALALFGGAAIGAGIGLACLWRGERSGFLLIGGMIGGLVIGALGSGAAAFGMEAVTGIFPGPVTGLYEGMALGFAAAAALLLAVRSDMAPFAGVGCGALIGGIIGGLTALAGGHFLGATFNLVETHFPASNLDMRALGPLFGESGFHMVSRIGTSILEGATFVSAITAVNLLWRRKVI